MKYVKINIGNQYVICHQLSPSYAGDITPLNNKEMPSECVN